MHRTTAQRTTQRTIRRNMHKRRSQKMAATAFGLSLIASLAVAATPAAAAGTAANATAANLPAATTATAAAAETQANAGLDFDATWGGSPLYQEVQLATNGQGGYPNYRIPALTVAPNGDILASYDGRPTGADSPGPNSILQRRSTDGGVTWGEQTVINAGKTDAPIKGYSDPSYIVDRETGEIFNFHVFSQDVGFWGGQRLDNGDDRKITHANVSRSTDNGYTWTHETITPQITPDPAWTSRFAASGQGIQLRYGENAGRLVQQYTIINGPGAVQAVSAYSDDHGETWQSGEAFGSGMDENKSVELSDGRVMMNSRDSAGSKVRKIAYSEDGGETYGPVTYDQTLIDPTNNASILRAFPNAESGTPESKILLFSNAASQSGRVNGTVRMSCDDGQTWPVAKAFQTGGMAYSTMATLPDGNIGLLYEPNSGNGGIRFAKFNLEWLGGLCASVQVADAEAGLGETANVQVTVTNQTSTPIAGGTINVDLPAGWTGGTATFADLAPQGAATVNVPVTVPADTYTGDYSLSARLGSGSDTVRANFTFTVTPPAGTLATIVPHVLDQKDSYNVGDVIKINYNVRNWTSQTVAMVPTGNLEGFNRPSAPNCGYSALAAGKKYTCTTAQHTVTEADLEAGEFLPQTTWSVKSGSYNGAELVNLSVNGPAIEVNRAPIATVTATIVDEQDEYQVGDTIRYNFIVRNETSQNVAMVPTGNLTGFNRPSAPNCGYRSLAAGGVYECSTAYHVVTADDAIAGSFTPETQWQVLAGNYEGAELGSFNYAGPSANVKAAELLTVTGAITSEEQEEYAVGDVIRYSFVVKNLINQIVSVEPTGNLEGFNRPTPPNCGYQNVGALGQYTCTNAFHTITQDDLDAGSFTPETSWTIRGGNYSAAVLGTLEYVGPTLEFPVAVEPEPEEPSEPTEPAKPVKPTNPSKGNGK